MYEKPELASVGSAVNIVMGTVKGADDSEGSTLEVGVGLLLGLDD